MAFLKDLTVFGATNLISDTFANNIFANGFHHNAHDNDDHVLLAGGGHIAITSILSEGFWANQSVQNASSTTTTPQFGKVMINTTSTTYNLNVGGDSYVTGWSRAGSGFCCENNGVYYTHNSTSGEINITSSSKFLISANSATLTINNSAISRGTLINKYVWNANADNTYAQHVMKAIELFPTDNTSYSQGIRIHQSSDNWNAIVLCGADNTGSTGTSANTWGIYNNNGVFSITKNSSSYDGNCAIGNSGGTWYINNRLTINSNGFIAPVANYYNAGMYGNYNSSRLGHIWSIGTSYTMSADGKNPYTTYGMLYFYTGWSNSASNNTAYATKTPLGTYAGGHQIGFFNNGILGVSIGLAGGIWSKENVFAKGFKHSEHNNDDAVLLAGGGWKLESGLSVDQAANIKTVSITSNSNYYLTFVDSNNSPADYESVYTNAGIYFNPNKYSFGHGNSNTISGKYSHAEGETTEATGQASHAEGINTHANSKGAHAEGNDAYATGNYSHAEGTQTIASGQSSHAEGTETRATTKGAHAEGNESQATGNYSHAEGINTYAEAKGSHSEGNQTYAQGENSHAEGYKTYANDKGAHAEGSETQAIEQYSHSEGAKTIASGEYSHVEGYKSEASGKYSHAEGNETDATNESAHSEGVKTEASGVGSHSEGQTTHATGSYSHAEGYQTTASGEYSKAIGYKSETGSDARAAFAGGNQSSATAYYSFAFGTGISVSHENEASFGKYNKSNSDTIFSVGGGSSSNKYNLIEVTTGGILKVYSGIYFNGQSTFGTSKRPIYWNAGVPTQCDYLLNATVSSGTASRMAYYSGANTISSANSIYASSSQLSINSTSAPANSGNFQVKGTSTMRKILPESNNLYDLGSSSYRWAKLYIGTTDSYGSATKGIYWDNGVPAAMTYSLKTDVDDYYKVDNSPRAPRIAIYSHTINGIRSSQNLYGSDTQLYVNYDPSLTDWNDTNMMLSTFTNPEQPNFAVLGQSTFRGTINILPKLSSGNTAHNQTYTYSGGGYYANNSPNIRLFGDETYGLSTIEFISSKGFTSINKPSDCAFIQFNPCGITSQSSIGSAPTLSSSGEVNRLIIGVNNDSNDQIWLQTPGYDGLRHIVGTNNYRVLTSYNTYVSSNKGYINGTEITQVNNSTNTEKIRTARKDSNTSYFITFVDSDNQSGANEYLYTNDKLFFNPNKGALGHGSSISATGLYSHAEGYQTNASSEGAHAEGLSTSASNNYAHAEGQDSIASGYASHAEGNGTSTTNDFAHAEGESTEASGYGSHAEGQDSTASGDFAHAEGCLTEASNDYTHAEGNQTIASGYCSHAEGYKSQATGYDSHAEGSQTIASGDYSHAEGDQSQAQGDHSHAEGKLSISYGTHSHAEGESTQATGGHSHTEGKLTIASGANSHAEGYGSQATGLRSHAEGSDTLAQGHQSHAESWETKAYGAGSHAEGYKTVAGQIGYNTLSDEGHCSHAEGEETVASGSNSHTEGYHSVASGRYSHAENYYTKATGWYSHAQGSYTEANGLYSFASGYYTKADHENEVAFGKYNASNNDTIFSIGGGSSGSRYNLFEVTTDGVLKVRNSAYLCTNSGSVGIGTTSPSYKLHVNGQIGAGDLIPISDNTYTLGSSSPPKRWKALYIGTANSYGDTDKPIYWKNGVPTVISTSLGGSKTPIYLDNGQFKSCDGPFALSNHNHDDRYYTETECDGRYVKLDAGANEQTIKNSISSLSNGSIEIWRAISGGYPMIGFSNGTSKTKLGLLGFGSTANEPIFRNTSGTDYKLAHAGNISNKNATIGTTLTEIATIAGISIKVKIDSYASSSHTHNGGVAKTAWGQQYVDANGTLTTISGNMSGVGNIIPDGNSNTKNLGSSAKKWAKLYIGGSDSYGSATQGIYWNGGVPQAMTYSLSATVNSSGDNNAGTVAYYSGTNTISSATKLFYDGSLWVGKTSDAEEHDAGVRSVAGTLYMFAQNSSTGYRGLYTVNNGNSGTSVILIDKYNNITFNGNLSGDADTLDGYHASGLFTDLLMSHNGINHQLSVTIGGINKTCGLEFLNTYDTITYGNNGLQYFNILGQSRGTANTNGTPTNDWYHIIRMNHGNPAGYYCDIATCFNTWDLWYRRIVSGNDLGWMRVVDTNNCEDIVTKCNHKFENHPSGSGNGGNWVRILQFTISANALDPTISFRWHPTETARDIWADFNINIRYDASNTAYDINFYSVYHASGTRTLKCVSDGTTYGVWVKGTRNDWEPYGLLQIVAQHGINSYNTTIAYQDNEPSSTYNKYATTNDAVPIGTIMMWVSDNIPDGWLKCDGNNFSSTDYPELYALLGSGNLPNLTGMVPVGVGARTYGGITSTFGLKSAQGEYKHQLSISEMPAHRHYYTGDGNAYQWSGLSNWDIVKVQTQSDISAEDTGVGAILQTSRTGGNASTHETSNHNNIQPSYGVYFIIKAKSTGSSSSGGSSNRSGSTYQTSDIRKKYDIRDILNEDVNKLFETENGFIRHFKWKESNIDAYGFIAQELQEYCPEAVKLNNDDGFYAVNYNVAFSKIIGAMFKKIKELENKLKENGIS